MKTSLTVAIIARDAEKTLPACLDSFKNYVENIVIILAGESADKTEDIARQYTEHVYPFEWVDDFSKARNFSFEMALPLGARWVMWIDADDILKGADQLLAVIADAEANGVSGVWLPYHYAYDQDGNVTTILERERILSADIAWKWHDRVHETCGPPMVVKWARTEAIVICHQHRSGTIGAERNFKLLHMQLQEQPGDLRTILYLGYQHFAVSHWFEAAEWLDRYIQQSTNELEKWQALVYLGKCLVKLERPNEAVGTYLIALELYPDLAEPCYGLAEVYCRTGEYAKCIYWTEEGKHRIAPPVKMVFYNPLDYSLHPELWYCIALWEASRLDEALASATRGLSVAPTNPFLNEKQVLFAGLIREKRRADAFLSLTEGLSSLETIALGANIPKALRSFPEVRTAINLPLWKARQNKRQKRIAFFCGETIEPWAAPSLEEGGIGGSETAVIHIARRFAKSGWHVDVYGLPGKWEGIWDKVGYWRHQWYDPREKRDTLVSWRNPNLADIEHNSKRFLLWMHDLHAGDRMTLERAKKFDKILTVSDYAGEYLKLVYDYIPQEQLVTARNGIDLARFQQPGITRNPHKVVYSSSWDRGLDTLLKLWPRFREVVLDAELHVYYGTRGLEVLGGPYLIFKKAIEECDLPGVHIRGRLSQKELAGEFMSAGSWFYPSDFLETCCITAIEAMAAGLACVTSQHGAIPEVMGDVGACVPGFTCNDTFRQKFLGVGYAALLNKEYQEKQADAGKARAQQFTWDKSFETWQGLAGC